MNGVLIFRPPCTAQPYELLACGMLMFEPVPVPAPFATLPTFSSWTAAET